MIPTWINNQNTYALTPALWQSFTLTAGVSVDWIGYVSPKKGLLTEAGSITREPYNKGDLYFFVFDPQMALILVQISGDVTEEFEGYSFSIEGNTLDMFVEPTYDPVNDCTDFSLYPFPLVDTVEYLIERVPENPPIAP